MIDFTYSQLPEDELKEAMEKQDKELRELEDRRKNLHKYVRHIHFAGGMC